MLEDIYITSSGFSRAGAVVLQWPYLDLLPINTGTGGLYDIPTQTLQLKTATPNSVEHTNDSKTTAFGNFIGLLGLKHQGQTKCTMKTNQTAINEPKIPNGPAMHLTAGSTQIPLYLQVLMVEVNSKLI